MFNIEEYFMHGTGNKDGYSLIELLIVIALINILAAVAITAYVGVKEKAKNDVIIETASAARTDLKNWLLSSRSLQANLREIDTDFNGRVDMNDLTNGVLEDNVADSYITGRNSALSEVSPWFNQQLWNSSDPPLPGAISVTSTGPGSLRLVGTEKNGLILVEYFIVID